MLIARLVKVSDLDRLFKLTKTGGRGLTTMPKSKEELADRIKWSIKSAASSKKSPNHDSYLFVLEHSKKLVGMSAIYTSVSREKPSVFFKRKIIQMYSHSLKMRKSFEALQLSFVKNPYTELGTLFMNPNARGIGGGKLLSFARFLYMSNNLNRFDKEVVVEIRGYKNATGVTPFWDKFSSKFFDLNFFDADNSSYIDNHFIGECVPSFPLILDFLPREVTRYCGKPHTTSKLALSLLNSQGFKSNGMVDVLDGGPCLSSKLSKIKVIQNKNQFKVKIGRVNSDQDLSFAFNNSLVDFWATRLFVERISNKEVLIDRKDARHLGLKEGDSINLSH